MLSRRPLSSSEAVFFGGQRPAKGVRWPPKTAARAANQTNVETTMTDASADEELQAWREVHDHLSKAVLVTTEAVAVAKAERRYLVEEIFVNLTPDGKLSNTSVWKKSGKNTRKPAAKRKPTGNTAAAAKRRRKEEDNQAVNWQNVLGFGLPGPQHDVPILPNDAAGVAFAELYAAGDQINTAGIEDCPPAMMMSPMQAAQQSGGTAGFHPPVRHQPIFLLVAHMRIKLVHLQYPYYHREVLWVEERFFRQ